MTIIFPGFSSEKEGWPRHRKDLRHESFEKGELHTHGQRHVSFSMNGSLFFSVWQTPCFTQGTYCSEQERYYPYQVGALHSRGCQGVYISTLHEPECLFSPSPHPSLSLSPLLYLFPLSFLSFIHRTNSMLISPCIFFLFQFPFIVDLKYAFQTDGKLYLILQYLSGKRPSVLMCMHVCFK